MYLVQNTKTNFLQLYVDKWSSFSLHNSLSIFRSLPVAGKTNLFVVKYVYIHYYSMANIV